MAKEFENLLKQGIKGIEPTGPGPDCPPPELIGFHVLGSLDEETNRLVRDHMIFCPGCMKLAQSVEESIAETGKKLEDLCKTP